MPRVHKGVKVRGYASVVDRYVEGEVYYVFSNGIGVLTRSGIVMMDEGEYEII